MGFPSPYWQEGEKRKEGKKERKGLRGRKEHEIAGGLIHDRATPAKGSSALLPVR